MVMESMGCVDVLSCVLVDAFNRHRVATADWGEGRGGGGVGEGHAGLSGEGKRGHAGLSGGRGLRGCGVQWRKEGVGGAHAGYSGEKGDTTRGGGKGTEKGRFHRFGLGLGQLPPE